MKILLTNDDGISGEGLTVLASALLKAGYDVTVVAPDRNNSAVSHKINMREPLRLSDCSAQYGYPAYSLSGTPADCVLFAIYGLNLLPDAVLSGINDGNNLGSDCTYSGTVAAAQEGALNGIPSLALSTDHHCDEAEYASVAGVVVDNLAAWLDYAKQATGAVNINIPAKQERKGMRICRMARLRHFPTYDCIDVENGLYRHSARKTRTEIDEGENDAQLFRQGYITITPLMWDKADAVLMERWKK